MLPGLDGMTTVSGWVREAKDHIWENVPVYFIQSVKDTVDLAMATPPPQSKVRRPTSLCSVRSKSGRGSIGRGLGCTVNRNFLQRGHVEEAVPRSIDKRFPVRRIKH